MEKSEFRKARVSPKTKVDFEDICKVIGKQPTTKLRELIEEFVQREYGALEDRVLVHVFRPDGYDFGAWRVTMQLRDPEALNWGGAPIPFHLPDLPRRRIQSDRNYLAVVFKKGSQEAVLGGQFIKGEWHGHIYSNGIAEGENPTPIEKVRDELRETVTALLDKFQGPLAQ